MPSVRRCIRRPEMWSRKEEGFVRGRGSGSLQNTHGRRETQKSDDQVSRTFWRSHFATLSEGKMRMHQNRGHHCLHQSEETDRVAIRRRHHARSRSGVQWRCHHRRYVYLSAGCYREHRPRIPIQGLALVSSADHLMGTHHEFQERELVETRWCSSILAMWCFGIFVGTGKRRGKGAVQLRGNGRERCLGEVSVSDGRPRRRPIGNKRSLEATKQYHALGKGADGITKLAEASNKRNKVAEEMLSVEKQQSLIALFSMPGTNPELRSRFIELSQLKAIASLEKEVGASPHGEQNFSTDRHSSSVDSFPNHPEPNARIHSQSPLNEANGHDASVNQPVVSPQSLSSLLN